MPPTRRHLIAATSASLLLPLLSSCAQPRPREDYSPIVGQDGKDAMWVPTPDAVVERMLDMAEVKRGDRVVDLGSGDGKIVIAAARRGARARGIEYNANLVALSRRNAREAGVQADFVQGDIFQSDFSDADVVTLYLMPEMNERLLPTLLDMKPGTRVASHQFGIGHWPPDRTDEVAGRFAHLWIVPAKVGGTWTARVDGEPPLQVELRQQFQKLEGDALIAGERFELALPRLRGPAIRFDVRGGPAGTMRFEGTADNGGRINGTVLMAAAPPKPFTATRS
jgi:SAM-dependent methyltransferase